MIVNPDHMSQAGVDATLSLLEARHYSGVISPHGWMDPGNWPRIWKLGGMAFPGHADAAAYVQQWRDFRPRQTPYLLGWGYGADLGGLSEQPTPGGITYPFKSLDGRVTFTRQKTGDRTFDYDKDGVAHYGLYADWFADLRRLGGAPLVSDLWNGAEAYLEMWERADGIATPTCASGHKALRLGSGWKQLLRTAGQPQQRARAWSWCAAGGGADVAELSRDGRVELVGSTANGRRAGGATVGASAANGVHRHGTRAYLARDGHVTAVATATKRLARHPRALAAALRRLAAATATQAAPAFQPSPAQAQQQASGAPLAGVPLAGTSDPAVNAALALLCHLQVSAPA
jgi:hypothetical protein